MCGTVALTRQPMYVPRIPECVNEMTAFVHSIGITCYTCQPLIVNGALLGTFSFGTRNRAEYDEQELQLIRLVCGQVAIATARDVAREQQLGMERFLVAGQMAAKIAHEISNPLAAVTNVLYLLGNRPMDPDARKYLDIAQEQVARVADISRQMLGFYRESRAPSPVNLRRTTDSVLAAATLAATTKSLTFAIDVPRELEVQAIALELSQILTNLVANAIHFSPERESIGISALQRNRHVELLVADRGPGIRAEDLPKLFQPFFTTNKESGNGLGLWVSRELARRVDGDLIVVPSSQGATFKLLLRPAA